MRTAITGPDENSVELPEVSIRGRVALVLGVAFAILAIFGIGLVLPLMTAAFAGTKQAAVVPWMATLVGPSFALASPLAGFLVGKYGYKRIYLLSVPVFVIAGTAPACLDDLWAILPFRLLIGAAAAGVMTAALDGIGRLPASQQPALFGLQNVIASITGIIAFPLIGYLAKFGWHAPFLLNLVGLLVLPFALALPRPAAAAIVSDDAIPAVAGPAMFAGLSLALCLLAGSVGLIIFAGSIYSPSYLAGLGIHSPGRASLAVTIGAVVCMLSSALYGLLHGRSGTNMTFVVAMLLIAAGMTMLAISATFLLFTLGLSVYGLGIGLCVPNIFTWAAAGSPNAPGQACAFANCGIYLTPICFPFLAPALARAGGAGGVFILMAFIALAWLLWFGVKALPRQPRPHTAPKHPA